MFSDSIVYVFVTLFLFCFFNTVFSFFNNVSSNVGQDNELALTPSQTIDVGGFNPRHPYLACRHPRASLPTYLLLNDMYLESVKEVSDRWPAGGLNSK